jgi:hypothetical protein
MQDFTTDYCIVRQNGRAHDPPVNWGRKEYNEYNSIFNREKRTRSESMGSTRGSVTPPKGRDGEGEETGETKVEVTGEEKRGATECWSEATAIA